MRPTIKEYNKVVLAADNWRQNADAAIVAADYWLGIAKRFERFMPVAFLAGVLAGVLGSLIWASIV